MFVVLIFLSLIAVLLLARWRRAEQRASSVAREFDAHQRTASSDAEALRKDIAALNGRIEQLAKWEQIADADDEAKRILQQARTEADRLIGEASATKAAVDASAADVQRAAQEEATRIRHEARAKGDSTLAEANARLGDAEQRARRVIDDANRKAEEIAGEALKALQDATDLERTVRTRENVVEGYGNRYIVPTQTLLDELADAYGHTEAGQQLKIVRERIRDAVRDGKAAACDYVEENRRETALRFVVDAFNGKVDSILAKVRHDNVGTLRQAIKDAYALVNHNGKAFRNARIVESYLSLREEELQWATVVHALKEEEREEQRRLKEQLREEERARKEYERAMKDAAREEEVVRKAMAKAEEQLAKATDEQRAAYELKLKDLQDRLAEAEARSQRALSMAQQTKRGHVYIISNIGSFGENVFKIGLTRRLEPLDRVRELGDSSVPFDFDVHALVFAEDAPALETQLHRHFVFNQINKVNHRKEFFRVTVSDIRSELEGLGLAASWTMTAAAQQYRESLAIEKAIQDNPVAREAWVNRQLLLDPVVDVLAADAEVEAT